MHVAWGDLECCCLMQLDASKIAELKGQEMEVSGECLVKGMANDVLVACAA